MTAKLDRTEQKLRQLIDSQRPGYSLQQPFYTDPEIYALEVERIINRHWILAGHASQWQKRGDYRVLNVGVESAIIVRSDDGTLKAFANVCRHRGSLVCLEKEGHAKRFQCPYHGWTYGIDGNLTAARNMGEDFDRSEFGLHPVSVGEIHGLVLVSFNDDPPSLDGAIRELAEPMAMYGFENLKVVAERDYPIPANWKLAIENYQECYHCATAHPEYARMHTMMVDQVKRERVSRHMHANMAACGVQDFEISRHDNTARPGEIGYGYWRTAMFDKYKTGSRDGEPVAPLLGSISGYDGGQSDISLGPFSYLLAYNDHVVAYTFTPVDQENCNCRVYWLVRGDAKEGSDYDVDELTWLWDVTTRADKKIIVDNAKGVSSSFYRPGPLSGMEDGEQSFLEWVLTELRRP